VDPFPQSAAVVLTHFHHLTDIDAAIRALLSGAGTKSNVPAGAWLWREGDPGDSVVLLLDGALNVVHEGTDGELVVLRELAPGSVLGEIACLDGHPRSAGVRATTGGTIARVPAEQFRELLRQHPTILEALLLQQIQVVRSLTGQVTRTHQRAITDTLTRLYNIGFFSERLDLELERARQTADPVSLVIFDVDHFKHYNDTQGHQEGNVALVKVADILRRTGRRGDIIARYGGEEFVALLYGAGREEANRFADTVRLSIESADFAGGPSQPMGRVTLSGGVAAFPDEASTREQLIEAADRHLYRAKNEGRNRICTAE
jgi:diguanylate cyclase (GGDEF)-like protein